MVDQLTILFCFIIVSIVCVFMMYFAKKEGRPKAIYTWFVIWVVFGIFCYLMS
jgi:hypothetical protein